MPKLPTNSQTFSAWRSSKKSTPRPLRYFISSLLLCGAHTFALDSIISRIISLSPPFAAATAQCAATQAGYSADLSPNPSVKVFLCSDPPASYQSLAVSAWSTMTNSILVPNPPTDPLKILLQHLHIQSLHHNPHD